MRILSFDTGWAVGEAFRCPRRGWGRGEGTGSLSQTRRVRCLVPKVSCRAPTVVASSFSRNSFCKQTLTSTYSVCGRETHESGEEGIRPPTEDPASCLLVRRCCAQDARSTISVEAPRTTGLRGPCHWGSRCCWLWLGGGSHQGQEGERRGRILFPTRRLLVRGSGDNIPRRSLLCRGPSFWGSRLLAEFS